MNSSSKKLIGPELSSIVPLLTFCLYYLTRGAGVGRYIFITSTQGELE